MLHASNKFNSGFLIICGVLISSIYLFSASSASTMDFVPYVNPDYHFKVQHPSSWSVRNYNATYPEVFGVSFGNQSEYLILIVQGSSFPIDNSVTYSSVHSFFRTAAENTSFSATRAKIIENTSFMLDGIPAQKEIISYIPVSYSPSRPGVPIFKEQSTLLLMSATGADLRYIAYANSTGKTLSPVIQKMIKSIQIEKVPCNLLAVTCA